MSFGSVVSTIMQRRRDPSLAGIEAVLSNLFAERTSYNFTSYLRASQIYDCCPREFVLNYWSPRPAPAFDMQSRLKMLTGTYLHQYFQNFVFGPLGVLYGNWLSEHENIRGYHPDPERALAEAEQENQPTWILDEFQAHDPKYRIVGHVDGLLSLTKFDFLLKSQLPVRELINKIQDVDDDQFGILELKFPGVWGFDSYQTSDLPEYYKQQANVYQGILNIKRTLIVYIERDKFRMDFSWYNHEAQWWNDAKNLAELIWSSIRDKTLPEARRKCSSPKDKRAKKCPQCDLCFANTLPDTTFDFAEFVADCIKQQPLREWLDLSNLSFS